MKNLINLYLIGLAALCILLLGIMLMAVLDQNYNGIQDSQEYKVHYQEE